MIPRGGGGLFGALASPGRLTHPPPHLYQKNFPPSKNEIYQRDRKFEADFTYRNFFWPLTPSPPEGRVFCPQSNGLEGKGIILAIII